MHYNSVYFEKILLYVFTRKVRLNRKKSSLCFPNENIGNSKCFYTNSMMTIGAASPRRGPNFKIRV